MKEALFYEKLRDKRVRCALCPHTCTIAEAKSGVCGVRVNRDGVLYSAVYGKLIALHVDPIEKKPLFHVFPGSRSFSIATAGCNFSCEYCQNSDISQMPKTDNRILGKEKSAEQVVRQALDADCKTIAYTYTEPTIFYEFALECAELAHCEGMKNVFVTNGFISEEPLRRLHILLDAANVDLKCFDRTFYKKVIGGELQPVLDSLILMKELGIWVEVTTLLIPKYVDTTAQLSAIARFIVTELGPETPWHVSRFYPHYKLTMLPPTPVESLARARKIGLDAGLKYVYSGNAPGNDGESTFCHRCNEKVIERFGYQIVNLHLRDGACAFCGTAIEGIGM